MFDVNKIRNDFPTISANNIYFDSVASSLTPMSVVNSMNEYYTKYRANVNRGFYDFSMKASEKFEESVASIANLINSKITEIVITSNATHSINEVALSLDFEPGDEVVLSTLEHSSNMVPWARLEKKIGIGTRWYNPGELGLFNIDEFEKLLTKKTKLVSLTYVSNAVGTLVPVKQVSELCKSRGILFLVDAAQAVPHMKIDVQDIGCDFLAFSGHKMLGPTGVGVLYVKEELAESLMPAFLGGGTINTSGCSCSLTDECNIDQCNFNDLPHKWQAGTPPIAEAIGLKAAIDYLNAIGFDDIGIHGEALMKHMMNGLNSIPHVDIFGPNEPELRKSIVSFNIGDLPPTEVGRILDEKYNIAARAGDHCAVGYFKSSRTIEAPGNVRVSLYIYNTEEEVNRFLNAIEDISRVCIGR